MGHRSFQLWFSSEDSAELAVACKALLRRPFLHLPENCWCTAVICAILETIAVPDRKLILLANSAESALSLVIFIAAWNLAEENWAAKSTSSARQTALAFFSKVLMAQQSPYFPSSFDKILLIAIIRNCRLILICIFRLICQSRKAVHYYLCLLWHIRKKAIISLNNTSAVSVEIPALALLLLVTAFISWKSKITAFHQQFKMMDLCWIHPEYWIYCQRENLFLCEVKMQGNSSLGHCSYMFTESQNGLGWSRPLSQPSTK